MPAERNYQEVVKILHEVFKNSFITHCQLNEESVTQEELKTLKELDDLEVLENLQDLLSELFRFKQEHKRSDISELIQRAAQFEAMIQKLEGEVRNHIRVIHYLDSNSAKDSFRRNTEQI